MGAWECLVCGEAIQGAHGGSCPECASRHLVGVPNGHAERRRCSPELLGCGAGHALLSAPDKVHVCA